jgi:hypothetical protein
MTVILFALRLGLCATLSMTILIVLRGCFRLMGFLFYGLLLLVCSCQRTPDLLHARISIRLIFLLLLM